MSAGPMLARALPLLAATAAFSPDAGAQVVPEPRRIEARAWEEDPGPMQRVHAGPGLEPQVEVLLEALRRLGAEEPERVDGPAPVVFVLAELNDGETYRVRSPANGLIVTASSTEGAAHAVATLLQLVQVEDGRARWPALKIDDGPDHGYRSFMVDLGRNPHSPETLRRVVDWMSFYKGNLLHLHLSDDQLCSWPSRAFPKLTSERAGWTWDDFVELEAYSQARGVTIVPELDVPGHSSILRREYPEVFGREPADLATSAAAQEGLETLLGEMLSVFRATPYVHVGGDEAYSVPEEAQRDLIRRLSRFVRSKGRRTVVWEGPRIGTGENKVDEDVLHINWRTINVTAQEMLDAGYEVVNAAWDPMYVVDHYPRTMFTAVDLERCYGWEPRRFAHINHEISTFAEPHVARSAEGILGFCMPWWEGREENIDPLCLPRFAAVTSAAWNRAGEDDFGDFRARFEASLARLEAVTGVALPGLPVADPSTQVDNLAFGATVHASRGASQPHFGPQRLTNGITHHPDHFLGFPTQPDPLEITVDLGAPSRIGRVVVHEVAQGGSYELYELHVSADGDTWESVGEAGEGTRGEAAFVEHTFPPREARYLRVRTRGCHGLTFPSFSRLTEVQAYAE